MTNVLEINDLKVIFPIGRKMVNIVHGIDLSVSRGKTLGIVGESGSGKSMTALAIMGLVPYPGAVSGIVNLEGTLLTGLEEQTYEKIRGSKLSIVFQDSSTSLNPVMTIGQQMVETILRHHRAVSAKEAGKIAVEQLNSVEITNSVERMDDYPHQLSGGMKQRVLIAMALACEPQCLILDEPTTALDVTVQSQLLDLIEAIQKRHNTAIVLISHDLGIVAEVADEVAIMYAGRFVEKNSIKMILERPQHPYTKGLLDSIPGKSHYKKKLKTIGGFPPSPAAMPAGCPFNPRCPYKSDRCLKNDPPLKENQSGMVACWHAEEINQ